jgi:hypothetical protein
MAPLRRVRDETLLLRASGVADRVLASHTWDATGWNDLPSQRRFQVSPDARVLAHLALGTGALHLLRRDGVELVIDVVPYSDFRFSPDSTEIAVKRAIGKEYRIDRVDLRHMKVRPWAAVGDTDWMEYCALGLLVGNVEDADGDRRGWAVSFLPREGRPKLVVRNVGLIHRLSAASAGTRFAYACDGGVWSVDAPGKAPRKVCSADVTNMEMSPDGRALAVVTSTRLSLFEGDSSPNPRVWNESGIHSVWFSPRGELAWASREVALWHHEDLERRLVPVTSEGKLAALRFLRGGAGIVLSRGAEVVRWSPEAEDEEVITRNDDAGRELLGADIFGGGLVMWLGTPWQRLGRGT